jgi:hypothetical protein
MRREIGTKFHVVDDKWRNRCGETGGYHGGDYEELRLLGCYAVWLL